MSTYIGLSTASVRNVRIGLGLCLTVQIMQLYYGDVNVARVGQLQIAYRLQV